jgi:hypothetical protein
LTEENYLNARPLDVHTWSAHPEVNAFVNEIYDELTSISGNERINKKLLKVLLLDLYVAWCADPTLMIMFSRDNNAYVAGSRYNEIKVGKKIRDIVDTLEQHGIVHQKVGFQDRVANIGYQSRLWASDKLEQKFSEARFSRFSTCIYEGRESIILRDRNKKDVDYEDTPETHRMRSLMADYNALLDSTHIDISNLEEPVVRIEKEGKKRGFVLQIDQKSKFVTRIFNEERWDKGGRFYGGWWQRCPKKFREMITLDHFATAELDYSGLHIVILYAQEGINYWAEVNDDPYHLGINDFDPEIDLREAAKLLMLTAINAAEEKKTFAAFRNQAETGTPQKRLTDEQLKTLLGALRRKHEPISHKIASGAGIDLMYVDSRITERLIERFTYHHRCPILTVHDSYIVPFGYDRILHEEMEQAFEQVTGVTNVHLEHTTDYYDVVENEPRHSTDIPEPTKVANRHINDWKDFRQARQKPDVEPWYPTNTIVY